MYFFDYFMDLNKSPEEVMKDRWYTTNLENIDSILGMSPINPTPDIKINDNSILNKHTQSVKMGKDKYNRGTEKNVYINLSGTEVNKIKKEINKEIEKIGQGTRTNFYFQSYNNFSGKNNGYMFTTDMITKAIRKNKSTNLFTVDKSKLPASFRQSFETGDGDMVTGTAFIQNVVENANTTQTINNVADENAMDMEHGI